MPTPVTPNTAHDDAAAAQLTITTPSGPGTLSIYTFATNVDVRRPGGPGFDRVRGHRVIVTSRVSGEPDAFQVFERRPPDPKWHCRTPELTAEQLEHWADYRVTGSAAAGRRLSQWLDAMFTRHSPRNSA